MSTKPIEIELPTKQYDPDEASRLYKEDRKKGFNYVFEYYYKTKEPKGVMYYDVGAKMFKYQRLEDAIETDIPDEYKPCIIDGVAKRCSLRKEFKNHVCPYYPTVEINKPIFFKRDGKKYINKFPGLPKLFDNVKNYDDFDDETKQGVEFILNHINIVWCSRNENLFKYVKNWIINVLTLHKNETALYLSDSTQGIGKGSITNFLLDITSGISHYASTPKVLLHWNEVLGGKVLLILEEMPSSTIGDWNAYNETLKTYITEPYLDLEDKFMPRHTAPNYLNVIINSNNENAIKIDNSDRRYVCLDVSTELVGNFEYFDKLHGYVKNNKVKKCFYAYCLKHYDKNFKPRDIPMTERKKEILISNMNDVMQYIKDNHLLNKKGIDMSLKDLSMKFSNSQYNRKKKYIGKEMSNYISKISEKYNLKTRICHGYKWITMTFDELHELYKNRNLINDRDEFDGDKPAETKQTNAFDDECEGEMDEHMEIALNSRDKEIADLKKQIVELQKDNDRLKKQLNEVNDKPVVIDKPTEINDKPVVIDKPTEINDKPVVNDKLIEVNDKPVEIIDKPIEVKEHEINDKSIETKPKQTKSKKIAAKPKIVKPKTKTQTTDN